MDHCILQQNFLAVRIPHILCQNLINILTRFGVFCAIFSQPFSKDHPVCVGLGDFIFYGRNIGPIVDGSTVGHYCTLFWRRFHFEFSAMLCLGVEGLVTLCK